jgi:uncharacterized phage protein gp47/JayE
MPYGVTPTGFNRKPFDIIQAKLEDNWRNKLGQDQDLSPDSPNAMIIGLTAAMADECWQNAEDSYNSLNRNSAEGVPLDNSVALIGMERKDESATTVIVSLKGTNTTNIPTTTQVKQQNTNLVFQPITAGKISQDSCNWIQFTISTLSNSTNYRLYIDGNVYTYLSDGSATYSEIIAGLKAVVEGAAIGLTITDEGSGLMTIEADDKEDSYDISASSLFTIGQVQSAIEFECTEDGANEVAIGTITELSTSLSGVDSVYNYSAGEAGRGIETDTELRLRSQTDKEVSGFNFTDAIKAKIINDVPGVSYCKVYENDTMSEANSINPKSWEAVIEGGSETDIANALRLMKVAGMASDGENSVTVKDSDSIPHIIKYSRPDNLYFWIKVTINDYNSEEDFPDNGEAALKQSLLDYAEENFGIGSVVVIQKLMKPVFDIPGIEQVTIEIASTASPDDVPSYGSANINCSIRQKPNFDLTRMVVVL